MWFPIALVSSTLLTLISIFLVYQFVINKPVIQNEQQRLSQASPVPLGPPPESLPVSSPPSVVPSPSITPKPKASTRPSTIGTLTVLQNNLSQSSQTSGSSTISGTITLTGSIPSGTSIVIVARENGTTNQYQTVVSGISPTNNTTWTWNSAKSGTTYNLIAILKGSSGGVDTDYAQSQTYTIKAPATSQAITLNAGASFSAPTGTITVNCKTHNSDNTWLATVSFPAVSGALMYKLQLGSTSGASDTASATANTQSLDVKINDSVNYYAQYSVAGVSNPTDAQYSSFSTPQTIRCP